MVIKGNLGEVGFHLDNPLLGDLKGFYPENHNNGNDLENSREKKRRILKILNNWNL
jgi:hypothetical protein